MSKREPEAADRVAADEPFLQRWSRLKSAPRDSAQPCSREEDASAPAGPAQAPAAVPQPTTGAGAAEVALPDLDTLGPDSDYSAFLAPGVDASLRRTALRKLFHSPKFNVLDGLDDYCDDFTQFAPLAGIVTADMRHQAERVARELLTGDAGPQRPSPAADAPATPPRDDAPAAARAPDDDTAAAPGAGRDDTTGTDDEDSKEDAGHGPA